MPPVHVFGAAQHVAPHGVAVRPQHTPDPVLQAPVQQVDPHGVAPPVQHTPLDGLQMPLQHVPDTIHTWLGEGHCRVASVSYEYSAIERPASELNVRIQ